jgi:glycosyltransferase involved in cell wall biosynthesis
MGPKIAICITTKDRPSVMAVTLTCWQAFKPANADIFIVDDGSKEPYPGATFRFETSQGVSVAKNKCLELSEGYDYVFVVDDDTRPTSSTWHHPYLVSGLKHACYTFDRKILDSNWHFISFEKPCGCMLFFTRECVDTAGGWDTRFKGYGMEHVSLSDRIFNMGLTPARYVDATGAYFQMSNCETSFTDQDKSYLRENIRLYEQEYYSREFIPYK